ncbi:MAG: hypothetical protein ACK6EB_22310, partial [Planctomyces sp.]
MVVVEFLRFRHVESLIFLIPPKRTSCQLRTPLMLLRTLITGILWLNVCVLICPAGQPSAETRQFIAADSSKQKVALIAADGQTIWQHRIGPLHDLHVLPDGHVLMQLNWTEVVEIVPGTGEIVWRYDAAKQPA